MMPRHIFWVAPLAMILTACDSNNPSLQSLSVSTTTKAGTTTGSTTHLTAGALTLSGAQVVLRQIMLAPVGTACATETEHDDAIRMSSDEHEADDDAEQEDDQGEGCEPVKVGPVTVSLPLDATTKVILDALVPAGTYTGVKAQLGSVTVSGVFTDAGGTDHPFTFTSTGHAVVHIRFPAPVTVGPATTNVTVTVDVASWFKTESGAFLDPADPTNLGAINRNIRRSFRAFGDDDHDGIDDDHDEHEGDHGD